MYSTVGNVTPGSVAQTLVEAEMDAKAPSRKVCVCPVSSKAVTTTYQQSVSMAQVKLASFLY
jgi:hypothetical protein